MGTTLPVLLQLLLDVQQDCSFPILHNMTLSNRAAIRVQLLIRQHEPNQAMSALLDLTPTPEECPISCVWQVTVAAIQANADLLVPDASTDSHNAQLCQAIFQFLWSWRPPDAGSTGACSRWDACLVATVSQLGALLDEHGPECLTEPTLAALCCVLACRHTCSVWLTVKLARPGASGTKGMKKAFDAFSICFQHDTSALLLGCSNLLRPESNQPVAVRMEGLLTMDRAVDKYLQDNPDSDDTQLMLWPDEAVQLLLFTCTKDTSVRIRRAVMSLLTSVVSRQQSIQEADIISTLVLKCRDKDSKVQTQAYEMLLQLPINILRAHLSVEDWCAVLDTALLSKRADHVVCAAGNERAEIQKFGTDLLHKYLDSQELLPWVDTTAAGALHGVSAESAALRALEFASCRLKALQLPWHNSTVYDAYGAALSSFESQQLQENL
ncbi:hypothetical protein ABBQ32_001508 [Trebouxia sp. C0010 RCD-2024]